MQAAQKMLEISDFLWETFGNILKYYVSVLENCGKTRCGHMEKPWERIDVGKLWGAYGKKLEHMLVNSSMKKDEGTYLSFPNSWGKVFHG